MFMDTLEYRFAKLLLLLYNFMNCRVLTVRTKNKFVETEQAVEEHNVAIYLFDFPRLLNTLQVATRSLYDSLCLYCALVLEFQMSFHDCPLLYLVVERWFTFIS